MNTTNQRRDLFKANRRKWEFLLISQAIEKYYPQHHEQTSGVHIKPRILEFGSGPSAGAELLCKIGQLTVSDIYEHHLLNLPEGVEFVISDIHKTSFSNNQFDILVSNQVLEHLDDLDVAFKEMQRITDDNGYFFFSVPTAFWLILTIPGQIFKKLENLLSRFGRISENRQICDGKETVVSNHESELLERRTWKSVLAKFRLGGHGCYPGFIECFRMFQVRNWRNAILSGGFTIIDEMPLITYGSSHLPIIPTNRILAKYGLQSSHLFIGKKLPVDKTTIII